MKDTIKILPLAKQWSNQVSIEILKEDYDKLLKMDIWEQWSWLSDRHTVLDDFELIELTIREVEDK